MAERRPVDDGGALVSCVTTFLDAARFLGEAIESVVSQTYPNWELVLVDDGSTDRSRAIAEGFARLHPDRIRILSHPGGLNEGKSVSRNLGVRAARGEIIALLDADDIWLPGKLAAQMRVFAEHPGVDFVYGPVLYHYSWTGRPQDAVRDCNSGVGVPMEQILEPPLVTRRLLRVEARRGESICPYPSAVAFRPAMFEQAGGFEPDFRQLYDDAIFFAKALAIGRAYVLGEVLCKYRLHPAEKLSHSYEQAIAGPAGEEDAMVEAERRFLDRTQAFLDRQGITEGRLRLALADASLRYAHPEAHVALDTARRRKARITASLRAIGNRFRGAAPRPQRSRRMVKWGDLGRAPIARAEFINARGGAIADRHFEQCVRRFAADLAGDLAEFGDDVLLRRYRACPQSTITVLDPATIEKPPDGDTACFDCVVAQDVLRFSPDPREGLEALAALVRPGGVLLTSLTGVAPALDDLRDRWRFTVEGARTLFARNDRLELTDLLSCGGIEAATAVLHGMGQDDLRDGSAPRTDHAFPVSIFVRAVRWKPESQGDTT